jgi:hypothetical protein
MERVVEKQAVHGDNAEDHTNCDLANETVSAGRYSASLTYTRKRTGHQLLVGIICACSGGCIR